MFKYGERWSYRQIAERLGITEKAVDARLTRARARLRSELIASGIRGEEQ
jgi:RNA polymerase sigma factor (sigma-70 family)